MSRLSVEANAELLADMFRIHELSDLRELALIDGDAERADALARALELRCVSVGGDGAA